MMMTLLFSTVLLAATPTPPSTPTSAPSSMSASPSSSATLSAQMPVPNSKESRGLTDKANPPATIAAEVKKDCHVKPMGEANHAEICIEGNKKYCPKGYTLKQKPHACPQGKMCAAVMTDYCEKAPTK